MGFVAIAASPFIFAREIYIPYYENIHIFKGGFTMNEFTESIEKIKGRIVNEFVAAKAYSGENGAADTELLRAMLTVIDYAVKMEQRVAELEKKVERIEA